MYNEYELHGMTDEKIRTAHFSQVISSQVPQLGETNLVIPTETQIIYANATHNF